MEQSLEKKAEIAPLGKYFFREQSKPREIKCLRCGSREVYPIFLTPRGDFGSVQEFECIHCGSISYYW